jgi:hypothetical protein
MVVATCHSEHKSMLPAELVDSQKCGNEVRPDLAHPTPATVSKRGRKAAILWLEFRHSNCKVSITSGFFACDHFLKRFGYSFEIRFVCVRFHFASAC